MKAIFKKRYCGYVFFPSIFEMKCNFCATISNILFFYLVNIEEIFSIFQHLILPRISFKMHCLKISKFSFQYTTNFVCKTFSSIYSPNHPITVKPFPLRSMWHQFDKCIFIDSNGENQTFCLDFVYTQN